MEKKNTIFDSQEGLPRSREIIKKCKVHAHSRIDRTISSVFPRQVESSKLSAPTLIPEPKEEPVSEGLNFSEGNPSGGRYRDWYNFWVSLPKGKKGRTI